MGSTISAKSKSERHLVAERLGREVASRRTALGLSQGEVAEKLGLLSPETVSRYERGEREPRVSTLVRLARVLGTTAAELVARAEQGVWGERGGPTAIDDALAEQLAAGQRTLDRLASDAPDALPLAVAALEGMLAARRRE